VRVTCWRQRTQLINALRGHLAEYGMVVRQGAENAPKLVELVMDPASDLPQHHRLSVPCGRLLDHRLAPMRTRRCR
jgi:transposase